MWYASLPGAAVDSAYLVTFFATGGVGPNAWSLAAGTLPPGLSLDATGTLSGTATMAGTYTFVVHVTDRSTPARAAQCQFTIGVFTSPLSVTTISLPSGVVGTPYADAVTVNGGAKPYAWSVRQAPCLWGSHSILRRARSRGHPPRRVPPRSRCR